MKLRTILETINGQSSNDNWETALRQGHDYKISLMEGRLTEGIGWDRANQLITVDDNYNEGDVIDFSGPIVYKVADGVYAGFVFREQNQQQKEKTAEDSLFALAAAFKKLEEGIKKVNDSMGASRLRDVHTQHDIPERLPVMLTNNWWEGDEDGKLRQFNIDQLKSHLGRTHVNTLERISGKDDVFSAFDHLVIPNGKSITPLASFDKIYELLEDDQAKKLRELVRAKTKQPKTKAKMTALQKYYNEDKRSIINQLNGDEVTDETTYIISFGAQRLASFIKEGGLGFTPNMLVLPVSAKTRKNPDGNARKLISKLADEIKSYLPEADIINGLIKNNTNVEYYTGDEWILLTDNEGNAYQDLPTEPKIGQYINLQQAANSIAKGTFKITSVYPTFRKNFKNFMQVSDDMVSYAEVYREAGESLRVLALDDCIYSGATQRNTATALKQYAESNDVPMEIATYALVKT